MRSDIVIEHITTLRAKDRKRYEALINEGMKWEQGEYGKKEKEKTSLASLEKEYFPKDATYAAISKAVLEGKRDAVVKLTGEQLSKGKDPVDLVSHALMPGIQVQCERYDQGDAYVPDILMSNEAMLGGIKLCQDKLGNIPKTGKAITFVTEGDLHDIGKNIVAAIMRANGYDVIDLGRDVPASKVVEAAKRENVHIVCGSTLMSTTKPGLVEAAGLLAKELPKVPVACGGAAVSKQFVDTFDNAIYTKSPLITVNTANGVREGKNWKEYR
ncbi:MAG: cobalamin-dependent protein [Methanomassiliicoccaceae archaeon]|jgi:methylated-thiol--corrinoid protein|nr:cobalamin-dependent protein [Methanomassiliicoccaceae archaeon]